MLTPFRKSYVPFGLVIERQMCEAVLGKAPSAYLIHSRQLFVIKSSEKHSATSVLIGNN